MGRGGPRGTVAPISRAVQEHLLRCRRCPPAEECTCLGGSPGEWVQQLAFDTIASAEVQPELEQDAAVLAPHRLSEDEEVAAQLHRQVRGVPPTLLQCHLCQDPLHVGDEIVSLSDLGCNCPHEILTHGRGGLRHWHFGCVVRNTETEWEE